MIDEYPMDDEGIEEEKPSLAKQMGLLDRKPGYVEKNRPAPTQSVLKYPIGYEPPPPEEQPHTQGHNESLLLRSYSATLSTDDNLKNLSQVLSHKADKRVSQSAIIRALVQLAADDPASIPKILKYVLHEEIKPGRK